jgi:hypothetical protein
MALIPVRCRRTWGTAKSSTPRVIRRWRRIGSRGSGRTRLAAVFAVGRFAAFTASCSQRSARFIQRALRCSSSARSASRRQALALGVTALDSRNPVPHPCPPPPDAGNRGSIPFTAGRSIFRRLTAAATVADGGLSPSTSSAGPVSLSLKLGLPRPAHHAARAARVEVRE